MNNMFKRLFALVLAVVMVMSYGVMPVAADEGEGHTHTFVDGSCECGEKEVVPVVETDAPAEHSHSYNEEITTAATCTEDGVKTFICGSCEDTYTETIPATGHSYVDGVCGCGAEEVHTHSYPDGTVTTDPTCATAGVLTKTCDCGETTTEVIPATGAHVYENGVCVSCTAAEPETQETTGEEEEEEPEFIPCTQYPGDCALADGHEGACVLNCGCPIEGGEHVEGCALMTLEEPATVSNPVAEIGDTGYATLDEAFTAADDGDEVKILVAGTYALSTSGKDITITGAVEGVVFDNIGAKNMGGANVTFNNVTFDYLPNTTYTGLQHAGNLVYNDCIFNGTVFLYGTSETFNNCTFNVTGDAYNVWTYGAKAVAFNDCTFNSDGKSVLVYNEGACATDLTVTGCTFTASQAVEGKAAIEIDTSLMPDGTDIVISNSTATGFAAGSESGNTLWNDKKEQTDLTVSVDGTHVWPVYDFTVTDSNGNFLSGHNTLEDAVADAQNGNEIVISEEGTYTVPAGKNITITGAAGGVVFDNIGAKNMGGANVTFNNVTFDYLPNTTYTGLQHSGDLVYNDCIFNGTVFLYGTSETFNSCTFNVEGDAYNVWTYGAKTVAFDECTFSSDGKSVLVYNEGACATDLTVTDCEFIASASFEGKAAIEIDTSMMPDGTDIVISNSTATGFAAGSISGETLWNDKKDQTDLTVSVNGTHVWPIYPVSIGTEGFLSLADALAYANNQEGAVTITLNDDVTWETGAAHGSTPLVEADSTATVTIDGQGKYTLTATGAGVGPLRAANGTTLTFKNMTIVDESESYAENAWEFGYLEFGGNLAFEEVDFKNAIMVSAEDSAAFTNCSFTSQKVSEYAVWVDNGSASFSGCSFEGPRGLKVHEAYGTEVNTVSVNGCTFSNLTEKPGIAIGDLNANTTVSVSDSTFANCQPGDQNLYAYESDTKVGTFNMQFNANNKITDGQGNAVNNFAAQVGEYLYPSLDSALAEVQNGGAIKLLQDAVLTAEQAQKINTLKADIDANGNLIKAEDGTITVNGACEITNIGVNGAGMVLGAGDSVTFDADGNMEIVPAYDGTAKYGDVTVTHLISNKMVTETFALENGAYLVMDTKGNLKFYGEATTLPYTLKPVNNEATYIKSSRATLKFESNMFFETFNGVAKVDGVELNAGEFKAEKAEDGSTIITLSNYLLRKLDKGDYTLTIYGSDGNSADCNFYVKENSNADPTNPKTGDFILMPMTIMTLSAAALAVLLIGKKKHA